MTAVLLSAPPFELAQRVDRLLYDLNMRLTAAPPPKAVLLVDLDDPAWLNSLASLAYRNDARLVVSTLPQPPALNEPHLLGPTAIAIGGAGPLRATAWPAGGHLWLAPDLDGVLRFDRPLLEDSPPLPSLGLAAGLSLRGETRRPERDSPTSISAGPARYAVDGRGRHWLRFHRPDLFATATPHELAEAPEMLSGRIVVAGHGGPSYSTPLGRLSTRELVAESLIGYWQNQGISVGWRSVLLGWCVLAVALGAALLAARRPSGPRETWLPGGLALTTLGVVQFAAFRWVGFWVPIATPAFATLGALAYSTWQSHARAQPVAIPRASTTAASERVQTPDESPRAEDPPGTPVLASPEESAATAAATADPLAEGGNAASDPEAPATPDATGLAEAAAPIAPPAEPPVPQMLGRYELIRCIGHGAMGSVYLGRDPTINRSVAIKAIDLTSEFDIDQVPAAGERFLREAETAGRLNHPNIVTIFDAGRVNGIAYIAMEYLTGIRLSEHATPETLLPADLVIELIARAADALGYAHGSNVVHRDIKPANIMYDSASDTLKITDFGIARWIDVSRTRTGIVLGTPSFMSPEQLEGKNVNGHTDLFALGTTLYQLLTGLLPFRGTSMTELMFVIANEPHAPLTASRPDLPRALEGILDRALAKAPEDRFETGIEMAQELRALAARLA